MCTALLREINLSMSFSSRSLTLSINSWRMRRNTKKKQFTSFNCLKFTFSLSSLFCSESSERIRRELSTERLDYTVELLIVLDKSIYDKHQRFYKTSDENQLKSYMRLYYAHFVKAVNDAFYYSFLNDTQMSLNIQLKEVLLFTNVSKVQLEREYFF